MPAYRRILSLVDSSESNASVVGRAALLSKMCGATLALAAVSELTHGGEASISSRLSSISEASRRAEMLAYKAGLDDSEVLVSEHDSHALAATVAAWRPDLLVLGAAAPNGLQGWLDILRDMQGPNGRFDVLMVEQERPGIARRVANAMAGMF